MQYILTEDEMEVFRERAMRGDSAPDKVKLQELCTLVADNVPVKDGWYKGKVWGCILTNKDEWYCDDCPAQELCPHPHKEWSK